MNLLSPGVARGEEEKDVSLRDVRNKISSSSSSSYRHRSCLGSPYPSSPLYHSSSPMFLSSSSSRGDACAPPLPLPTSSLPSSRKTSFMNENEDEQDEEAKRSFFRNVPLHYAKYYVHVPRMKKFIEQIARDAYQRNSAARIKKQLKSMQENETLVSVGLHVSSPSPSTQNAFSSSSSAASAPAVPAGEDLEEKRRRRRGEEEEHATDTRALPSASRGAERLEKEEEILDGEKKKSAREENFLSAGKKKDEEKREEKEEEEERDVKGMDIAVASLKKIQTSPGTNLQGQVELLSLLPESRFRALTQQQVQRLNFFVQNREREVNTQLTHIWKAIQMIRKEGEFTQDVAARMAEELEAQSAEITHLDFFVRTNYKALVELGYFFDRLLHVCPFYLSYL
ncbi:vtc domain-containing protein [Cystoisospora suis]|uniref:Vtc domain-containing protein n=1 Tax=Cystoisospora suis TaxID=483139 RepID=A0A2C6KRW5_9APIC|nr:vtc domain-containing protein [Cystoisospora suis]